jgi:hypothetical protein
MDEDNVEVTREDITQMMCDFIRRMQDNEVQEVLSEALLLDLVLERENAALVLGVTDNQLRNAGECMRKAYRAFQTGDRATANEMARIALANIVGDAEQAGAETSGMHVKRTISLVAAPDGNYWIRILDEQVAHVQTRETAAPTLGPFRRNQLFHQLLVLGVKDQQADALVEEAETRQSAELRGVSAGEDVPRS